MDGPRPRRGSDYFRDLLDGIETAAGECRAEGFRGWMWALRTLGVDPPSCRSSDIEGVSFLDDVRRKRERALLALDVVGLRRAVDPEEVDAVLLYRAERALSSVRRAGEAGVRLPRRPLRPLDSKFACAIR